MALQVGAVALGLVVSHKSQAGLCDAGERTTVVHRIHVSSRDVELLAASRTIVVSCPTTEGNLGDGHLPALAYREAGVRLAIGSDSQVRIDPFEETRELETGARRGGPARHALLAGTGNLWSTLVRNGEASLGLAEGAAGRLTIDLEHPDLAGVEDGDLGLAVATCASAGVVLGSGETRPLGDPDRVSVAAMSWSRSPLWWVSRNSVRRDPALSGPRSSIRDNRLPSSIRSGAPFAPHDRG